MDAKRDWVPRLVALAGMSLLLSIAVGCRTTSSSQRQNNPRDTPAKAAAAARESGSGSDNPGINVQCAAEGIQKALAPFHWSYKKVAPPLTNADWEADITRDSIAGMYMDSSGTRTIHGVRSDSTSWNTAVMDLTGPLPASTFALVNNSSATVKVGTENVNGEEAIKYTIDTSQDTPADASLIRNVLGKNGFVRGTAWVTRTGCPVKFVLDVEQHNEDGTVDKEHDEANVTKR